MPTIRIRTLETPAELRDIAALEHAIWGNGDPVPTSLLRVLVEYGGEVSVAFEANRPHQWLGFSMSWGLRDAHGPLWYSHQVGVLPAYQHRGIGRRLKAYQNQWAQAQGYDRMVWTFDPMRATNAYFNLHVLGASVVAYRPNYYGVLQSRLNGGLPTDRWICVWPVPAWPGPPDVGPSPWRIEIPPDIGRLKQVDAEAAAQWQARVRSDVEEAFAAGYRVVDFIRTPHPAYLLTQERSPPSRA